MVTLAIAYVLRIITNWNYLSIDLIVHSQPRRINERSVLSRICCNWEISIVAKSDYNPLKGMKLKNDDRVSSMELRCPILRISILAFASLWMARTCNVYIHYMKRKFAHVWFYVFWFRISFFFNSIYQQIILIYIWNIYDVWFLYLVKHRSCNFNFELCIVKSTKE